MPKTWLGGILEVNNYVSIEAFVVFCVALTFLAGGLVCIANLFASRMIRSHYRRRENSLRFQYQKILNKIVVNEIVSEKAAPNAAFEFYVAELRLIIRNSNFARQLLLTQILEIKKNLTGNSATALIKTYYETSLYNQSLRNLKNRKWQKKAMAIRELAEMRYLQSASFVGRFLYSNNETLREESFMALVRLEDRPLFFLNHYKAELSLWMKINTYRYLQKVDYQKLPIFSQYFNHPNLSVRLFSMAMARQFKQSSSLPGLVEMLYSDNAKIVGLAISALGELEAYQYRQEIANLSMHVWPFNRLAKRVVQCLGKIGDKEKDTALLGKFLSHPCYKVRFEAVKSLKKLGPRGEQYLQDFNTNNSRRIDGILRHLAEPLLT